MPVPVMGKKQNSVDVNLKKKTDASNDIFCFQNNKDIKWQNINHQTDGKTSCS